MPIYEYECPRCGQVSEQLVRDPARAAVPSCDGCREPMRRKASAFACAGSDGFRPSAGGGGSCSSCSGGSCSTCGH